VQGARRDGARGEAGWSRAYRIQVLLLDMARSLTWIYKYSSDPCFSLYIFSRFLSCKGVHTLISRNLALLTMWSELPFR
jgi:hypothetical protein